MRYTFVLLSIFFSFTLTAQSINVNLSPQHQQKLNDAKSGHGRMVKYYRYYKRDSTRQSRETDKRTKRGLDSLDKEELKRRKLQRDLNKRGIKGDNQWIYSDSIKVRLEALNALIKDTTSTDSSRRVAKNEIRQITRDKANRALAKGTLPGTRPYKMTDSVKLKLQRYWALAKDSTISDSARREAKEKARAITLEHAMKSPQFQGAYESYEQYGQKPDLKTLSSQVPGLDTLQALFDSSPEHLMSAAEGMAETTAARAAGLSELSKASDELVLRKSQLSDFSDPEKLKSQGSKQAKDQAFNNLARQSGKLQSAQNRLSRLLGKYKAFSNSNDLSTAVKRTSLNGKSFRERFVLGGNFNIVSTEPFSLDISPLVGYRLNTKFYIGIGANYRHTFRDSLRYPRYVSPANTSFRLFANYDVFKNFFAYTEAERAGVRLKANDISNKKWKNNYFVGLGKKLLIHPKVYLVVTGLYNLNAEKNPSYPKKFQVRVGLQTSDLAFRKPKVYYNP